MSQDHAVVSEPRCIVRLPFSVTDSLTAALNLSASRISPHIVILWLAAYKGMKDEAHQACLSHSAEIIMEWSGVRHLIASDSLGRHAR